jgi:hypothetical protein
MRLRFSNPTRWCSDFVGRNFEYLWDYVSGLPCGVQLSELKIHTTKEVFQRGSLGHKFVGISSIAKAFKGFDFWVEFYFSPVSFTDIFTLFPLFLIVSKLIRQPHYIIVKITVEICLA